MSILLVASAMILQGMLVTAFDFSESRQVDAWVIIDDGVMGGVSQGNWYQEDDEYAVFEGEVSLDNNGGFSSVRVGFRPVDLSAYDGVALQVRGDGQQYALGLSDMNSRLDYRLRFETARSTDDEWETIYIPFDDLIATRFGRQFPDADPLNTSQVRGMNLIISDKQEGSFRLEIANISLYTEVTEEL